MKKALAIFLSLLLVITLFGCGKSEAVKNAESLINSIGEVTLESKTAIEKAEAAVQALNEKESSKVEGLDTLKEARNKYDALVVENAIDSIGEITLESKSTIDNAKKLYNALNSDAKELVGNYSILSDAEDTYKGLISQKGEEVLQRCNKEEDKVSGYTYYSPASIPYYSDERSYYSCYLGFYTGQPKTCYICIECDYTGDSWIFWKKLSFLIDGERFEKSVNYFDISRDNQYGVVWEWYTDVASDTDMEVLRKIAYSNETIVRFEGDDKYYDLTVPQKDKDAIKDILFLYEYFKM